ncbi:MAG: hypothetical protein V1822_00390, partial [Candidatus Micrarchaeota archaeon]
MFDETKGEIYSVTTGTDTAGGSSGQKNGNGANGSNGEIALAQNRTRVAEGFHGRQISSFVIGGITDVPSKDFAEHIEFINSIVCLLEYRYGVDSRTALRDAEKDLDLAPEETRASVCYTADQFHVQESGFLVAVLTAASTGTGQELERAAALGTPVIAFVRDSGKSKVGKHKQYFLRSNSGETEERKIHVSGGGLSIMVAGNPAIKEVITYKSDRHERPIKYAIFHAMEKAGWRLKSGGKIAQKIGDKLV